MSELQNGPAESYGETRQERVDGKVPEVERMAPVDRLPRQPVFLSVEYPGLLKPVLDRTAVTEKLQELEQMDLKLQELEQMDLVRSEEVQSENGTPHPSLGWRAHAIREARLEAANGTLNRALRTLCPIPEPYATAQLALNHMSGCVSHDSSVLECRLPTSTSTHRPDPRELSGRSADEKVGVDVYRHPFTGEFRDTNNIAIKVTTRRWIKKRRTESGEVLPARSSAQSSASDVVQAEERLEYKVDILGVIKKTVRYRTLADFAYMPRVEAPDNFARNALAEYNETPQATSTASTARHQTALERQASMLRQLRPQEEESDVSMRQTSSLSLLDSLLRLDIDAIRQYRIAPEMEDYDVPVEGADDAMQTEDGPLRVRSNLRMPPPPMFSRLVAPPSYKFRQNPGSKLKTDEHGESSRFVQKSRWRGFAPQQFSLRGPSSTKVPLRCQTHVAAERRRCSPQVIARLEELFQERPLWPRAALLNQLTAKERTALELHKAYIPLVCYVITDGPWRDALSRFGYDPRTDPESRFHQRFSFQSHNKARFMASKPRRNLGSKGDLHVTSGKGKTRGPTEPEEDAEDEEEEEEEEGQTMDRPGRSPPVRQAHDDQDDAVQGDNVDNQTLNEDGDLADDVAPQRRPSEPAEEIFDDDRLVYVDDIYKD
ncbi:RNA polymerase III transcription factor (TF)IIIC subunit [Ceraceosorus bombacis]|uniref:RNA polymerase III transcription factor (TF)IIIC subunit n=1 Tax=Ceraceosorus bombacis TaxID=401625 RepID=A0A0P1BQG9_9BASI|nr:RNA polymerase III transcription factor (TF)IIIC subunit [Ceraceosorus bombacis]